MSFESDIQGKNTQLFPVVEIDGIWYSTNNVTVDGNYCKPILMNIPSIKESVDVESRKFKISNVSLQFNNFPFDGVRFSDQLSESSLINIEATIYFKSPSTNTVDTGADTDLHEAYKGIIRRITHDDTKVSVELEDLTEKNAHKDLPKPENYIQTESLPDKYRNKPIPIAYGAIDRSPLAFDINDSEDMILIADENDTVSFTDDEPLYINESDKFMSVPIEAKSPLNSSILWNDSEGYSDSTQYSVENNFIALNGNINDADDDEDNESGNAIGDNKIVIMQKEIPSQFVALRKMVDDTRSYYSVKHDDSTITFFEPSGDYSIGDEATHSNLPITIRGIIFNEWLIGQWDGENVYDTWQGISPSPMVNDAIFGEASFDDSIQESGWVGAVIKMPIITGIGSKSQGYIFADISSGLWNLTPHNSPNFRVRLGGNKSGDHWGQSEEAEGDASGYILFSDQTAIGQFNLDENYDPDSGGFNGLPNTGDTYNSITGNHRPIPIDNSAELLFYMKISQGGGICAGQTRFKELYVEHYELVDGVTNKEYFGDVRGRINVYDDHPELLNDNPTFNELVNFIEDNEAEIVENSSQENYDTVLDVIAGAISLGSEDAYIDTLLSFISNNLNVDSFIQNPIDIIYDLVRSEIGHDKIDKVEYTEAKLQHKLTDGTDWKFGFTVNKKINSKKLIEEIAKSTKCFPKFKNDGTFGFNTIKDSYGVANDYAEATPIKESEVISYSFKKTKPEQIHKRVDVQYKKDYAQNSFLKRTDVLVTGTDTGVLDDAEDSIWKDDFYGIENSKDAYLEFESPYIRDEQTADALASFLSEQYRNDHLLFNLKLPLQYINLEIGDLVKFEDLFQGLTAYGIDYRLMSGLGTKADDDSYSQYAYPLFMVTSTKKNLDSVEIECMQLHELIQVPRGQFTIPDEWIGQAQSLDSSQEGVAIIQPEEEEPDFTDGEQVEIPRESVSLEQGTIQFLSDINGELLFDYTLYNMFTPISFVRVESGTLSQVFELTSNSGFHKFNLTPRDIEAFDAYEIQQFDGDLIVTQLNPADIFQLGDVNLDGSLNILDIVGIVNHILGTGAIQSEQHADFNEDGTVNILDIVGMVNRILGVG